MRQLKPLLAQVLVTVAMSAPVSSALAANSPDAIDTLVNAEWLAAHLNDSQLRVLDVRAPDEYRAGHIPGAVNLPVEKLFVQDKEMRFVAPVARVQQVLKQAGVGNTSRVVVYDSGKFVPSTRAFWVLEVYGHSRVAVLDGGLGGWVKSGHKISDQPVAPAPGEFVPTVTPDRLATKLLTRLALNRSDTVIIDARPKPEYLGEVSRAARYGHIPSAISLPGMEQFNVDGDIRYLKPAGELKGLFRGVGPGKKVITYCNNGLMSASTYFVLRRLGYDVSNYDGSWLEWGNDLALPIEEPQKTASAAQ